MSGERDRDEKRWIMTHGRAEEYGVRSIPQLCEVTGVLSETPGETGFSSTPLAADSSHRVISTVHQWPFTECLVALRSTITSR
jgi:hypothetical protein